MKRKNLVIGAVAATAVIAGGFAMAHSAGYGPGYGPGGCGGPGMFGQNGPGRQGPWGQGMQGQYGPGPHGPMGPGMRGQYGPGPQGPMGPGMQGQYGPGPQGPMGPGMQGQYGPGPRGPMGPGMQGQYGPGPQGPMGPGMQGQYGPGRMGPGYGQRGAGFHGGPRFAMLDPARLDTLKTELGITAEQEPAWTTYTKTVQDAATAMKTSREAFTKDADQVRQERFAARSKMREEAQKQFTTVKTAADELLAKLDDAQKTKAQATLPGLAFGPGAQHGFGPGWHRPWH